jgi:hypothetical protein
MHQLSAQVFYATAADMQKLLAYIGGANAQFPADHVLDESDRAFVGGLIAAMAGELTKFDCRAAIATTTKILRGCNDGTLTFGAIRPLCEELDGRIRDELSTTYAFTLTAQEASLFDPAENPIRQDFLRKFPSVAYDLEECAKCLALGRSTAAVFHGMRILEKGIAAMSACLGIPDPIKPSDRNWGKVLDKIKEAIDAKWPTTADKDSGDGHLFESLYALMLAVKNAWRNKSMHTASKYTEQEAARIINAGSSFMEQLAERCDEKGKPLAKARKQRALAVVKASSSAA